MEGPRDCVPYHAAPRRSYHSLWSAAPSPAAREPLPVRTPTFRFPRYKESRHTKIRSPRPAVPSRSTNKTVHSIHNLWSAARELLRCSKGQPELPDNVSFLDRPIIEHAHPSRSWFLRRMRFETLSCILSRFFQTRRCPSRDPTLYLNGNRMLSLR